MWYIVQFSWVYWWAVINSCFTWLCSCSSYLLICSGSQLFRLHWRLTNLFFESAKLDGRSSAVSPHGNFTVYLPESLLNCIDLWNFAWTALPLSLLVLGTELISQNLVKISSSLSPSSWCILSDSIAFVWSLSNSFEIGPDISHPILLSVAIKQSSSDFFMFPVINFAKLSLPMRISTFRSFFELSGSAICNPCNSDGNWTRPIVTGNGGQIVCVTSALSCICSLSVRTCIVTTSSDFCDAVRGTECCEIYVFLSCRFQLEFLFWIFGYKCSSWSCIEHARTVSCAVFPFNLTIADWPELHKLYLSKLVCGHLLVLTCRVSILSCVVHHLYILKCDTFFCILDTSLSIYIDLMSAWNRRNWSIFYAVARMQAFPQRFLVCRIFQICVSRCNIRSFPLTLQAPWSVVVRKVPVVTTRTSSSDRALSLAAALWLRSHVSISFRSSVLSSVRHLSADGLALKMRCVHSSGIFFNRIGRRFP